jgi:hypothetical protein
MKKAISIIDGTTLLKSLCTAELPMSPYLAMVPKASD